MNLSDYLRRNNFTYKDFLSLMSKIFEEMEKNKVFVFPVTMDNINVKQEEQKIEFEILGLEEYIIKKVVKDEESKTKKYLRRPKEEELVIVPTTSESDKITPIFEFMVNLLLIDSKARYDSPIDEIMTLKIPNEIKYIMSSLNKPGSLLNFKFFSLKMRELYKKSLNPRIFFFKENFHLPYNNAPAMLSKRSDHEEHEETACNYCGIFNLDPMLQLDECKCIMHTECMEKAIVETIKFKEFGTEFEYSIPCTNLDNHFHHLDMVLLIEVEKAGFTLAKNICKLVQYYYLNHHVNVDEKCNCMNSDHFLVDPFTKSPTELHNARCSFCGERYHLQCPEFLKSLEW